MNMLVRPSPMPEELDRGYLGHVMRINGFRTVDDIQDRMVKMFELEHIPQKQRSIVESLSLMAGQSTEQFVLGHSFTPLRRSITMFLPNLPHGSLAHRGGLHKYGMKKVRSGAYFCQSCVSEDQKFHGLSYWRRDHHVLGQLWCPKHQTPLNYVVNEADFLQCPSKCQRNARSAARSTVDQAIHNKFVKNYLEITSGLLVRPTPMDFRPVIRVLREQASNLGVDTFRYGCVGRMLSDHVRDAFPSDWLSEVLYGQGNPAQDTLSHINVVLNCSHAELTVFEYILAASVLFDSADEALNVLFSAADIFANEIAAQKNSFGKERIGNAQVPRIGHRGTESQRTTVPLSAH